MPDVYETVLKVSGISGEVVLMQMMMLAKEICLTASLRSYRSLPADAWYLVSSWYDKRCGSHYGSLRRFSKTDGAYVVLTAGDGIFQFLPLILAITSAKRFKMNQFTALAIGFALVYQCRN